MSKYEQRGVSASKSEVHNAIKVLDKGIFPNAFCKVLPDFAAGDPDFCNLMHADTAGTKTSLAYVYWKETGDLNAWKGIVQDALVMNLDDMACAGVVDNIIISSTIGRNKNLVPGEVLKALIEGTKEFLDRMGELGIKIHHSGGETADVGDIVRTADVGFTAFARLPRKEIIEARVQEGDVVIGIASYGQASYEDSYNSGIGSNGLTFARHEVLAKEYAEKYPESFDPAVPQELVYSGSARLTDEFEGHQVGKLLLSPTRTFLPVLQAVLKEMRPHIHALIHNTGGGASKVVKFIENMQVVKDNLLPVPPVFRFIQQQTNADWKEMYQVFNMGTRLEIYLPEEHSEKTLQIIRSFNIDAQVIGRCIKAEGASALVKSEQGEFLYR